MSNTRSSDLESGSSQSLVRTHASGKANLDMTGDRTIEAWFNFESLPASGQGKALVTMWNEQIPSRNYMMQLKNTSGTYYVGLRLYKTGGADETEEVAVVDPVVGTWVHYAVTWDASASELEVFVNGSSAGTDDSGSNTSTDTTTSSFLVGAYTDGSGNGANYFDGKVDEVRVWNDIRTSGEISANYNKEISGSSGNLQGYWKLNNSYSDETANSYDLGAVNSPVFSSDIPFGSKKGIAVVMGLT